MSGLLIEHGEPARSLRDPVEAAVKQGTGYLLGYFSEDVSAGYGSGRLTIRESGRDERTGLGSGFEIITDRVRWPYDDAAFEQSKRGFSVGYCSRYMSGLLIREISEGNFNIRELSWDKLRLQRPQALYEEYGLANIEDIPLFMRDSNGAVERKILACNIGVDEKDLMLTDPSQSQIADAAVVNRFFDRLFDTGLDGMHSA